MSIFLFCIFFLILRLILFYNRALYYYTRIFLILLPHPVYLIKQIKIDSFTLKSSIIDKIYIVECCSRLMKRVYIQLMVKSRYNLSLGRVQKSKLKSKLMENVPLLLISNSHGKGYQRDSRLLLIIHCCRAN